jgi:hypothetical protein
MHIRKLRAVRELAPALRPLQLSAAIQDAMCAEASFRTEGGGQPPHSTNRESFLI